MREVGLLTTTGAEPSPLDNYRRVSYARIIEFGPPEPHAWGTIDRVIFIENDRQYEGDLNVPVEMNLDTILELELDVGLVFD